MTLSALDIAKVLAKKHLPTPEQQRVIEHPLEPLLVVAGAGSGKTETMANRVVYLVANGFVRGDEVLGLTFTRKAAAELAARIRKQLRTLRARIDLPGDGVDADRPTVATYNAFAGNIARDHALRIGREPEARLLTEAGAWQLADDLVQAWPTDLDIDRAPGTVTKAVLALAQAVGEHLLSPDAARRELDELARDLGEREPTARQKGPYADVAKVIDSLRARARLMDVVAAYEAAKRERGLIDFADQVVLAARIARAVPEVGEQLRAQYRVVLLDEYQDTSEAQVQLLADLFGGGHPVTAVGDPNQAIYGWRGASAAALATFPRRFPAVRHPQPTATVPLSTAWRNDVAILEAANAAAGPLRHAQAQAADGGTGVTVEPLRARRGAGAGEVVSLYTESLTDEARAVARFLAQRWEPGQGRTAAVLCRARTQFGPIVAALEDAGLPYVVLGLGGLLATPEIVDLRATLQAAQDPTRGDALMRLLTNLRLGASDLHALHDWARHLADQDQVTDDAERRLDAREEASLVEAVDHPPAAGWRSPRGHEVSAQSAQRVQALSRLLRQVRSLAYLPLPELVVATEQLLGLDIEVAARPGRQGVGRGNLDAFADVAASFAADAGSATLSAFLAWLDAAEEHERGLDPADVEADPEAVQVLTVHAAKGLEWDVVAVPGLVEGGFPAYDGKPRPDRKVSSSGWLTSLEELPYPLRLDSHSLPELDLEGSVTHADVRDACAELKTACGAHGVMEERRLAYVALTRAKDTLLLTGSWFRSGATPRPPSRFLTELRDRHLVADLEPWAPAPEEGAENPELAAATPVLWPDDPLGERRPRLEAAAARVREAVAEMKRDGAGVLAGGLGAVHDRLAQRWLRDARLLLAERDARASREQEVPLGGHLSASAVMTLVADPRGFTRDRRRPVPSEPTQVSRRGTRFHEWVEHFYGAASLLDVDELPGGLTTGTVADLPDEELERLQNNFRASEWARRTPIAVEVDLETPVAGTMVRCRIDAVFDDEGGLEVVDWKTGRPPVDGHELAEREMQLALYRLAWSRHTGVPLERVGAAFYYVGHDRTVRAGALGEEEILSRVTAALRAAGATG